ncbi:hypothetical protein WJX72_010609 [[Myrmecia] bisecta]|uniref:Uncharacterized protein n=1 Tax=[Myrmecia] bisecta TaxID=41462 RepID=A0AAW1P3L8_9CHLO
MAFFARVDSVCPRLTARRGSPAIVPSAQLAKYLRDRHIWLDAAHTRTLEIIASDNGSLGLHANSPYRSEVILEAQEDALQTYQPHIVVSCWQPLGVDWTAGFRHTAAVLEYILIGEADDGICGHPWLTWGYTGHGSWSAEARARSGQAAMLQSEGDPYAKQVATRAAPQAAACSSRLDIRQPAHDDMNSDALSDEDIAPYAADGFVRVDLDSLRPLQVCCTDVRWSMRHHSQTVSFRRSQPLPPDGSGMHAI